MREKYILWKSILFVGIFFGIFFGLQEMLQPKWNAATPIAYEPTTSFKEFQSLKKNSLEVFFCGTSHVYYGIDPMVLYEQTGIPGFCIAAGGMRMDTAAVALESCFQSQQPQIVFLDMSAIQYVLPDEAKSHKILDQFGWNREKICFAFRGHDKNQKSLDVLFPFFRYHFRAQEVLEEWLRKTEKEEAAKKITAEKVQTVSRGHRVTYQIEKARLNYEDRGQFIMGEYQIQCLDRIVRICEKNHAQLVLMKLPAPCWTRSKNECVKRYAREHQLEFLDFYAVLEELQLDETSDFRDRHDHLNQNGAEKVTAYIGRYLKKQEEKIEPEQEKKQKAWVEQWNEDLLIYKAWKKEYTLNAY